MEECESSRTNGGVGGEWRGEHEMLDRALLLEPARDRWEVDDAEQDSRDRCGRSGLVKRGVWDLVVEMEVDGSSLSLRSDTFLPEASSPNIMADSVRAHTRCRCLRTASPHGGINTACRQRGERQSS